MPELSVLQIVGAVAVAGLVAGWLTVSFLPAGPGRVRAAWLAACCMYVAFCTLFTSLFLRAREAGSTGGMVGFGFLLALFVGGLGLALWKTAGTFTSRGARADHATH